MAVEVGSITQGTVTSVTKFGAFVKLEEGEVGMVHISEVASSFVKEISDFVKEGQEVKVKVIRVDDKGKISLSMKQAEPPQKRTFEQRPPRRNNHYNNNNYTQNHNSFSGKPDNFEFKPKNNQSNLSFEDMMSKFKQSSEEKMADLKRTMDFKKGNNRRGK